MQLEDIKRELNVTWSDPENDAKIESKWHRAEAIIEDKAGRHIDFDIPGTEQQLMLDCVVYLYSDSYAQFLADYSEELTALSMKTEGESDSEEQHIRKDY